MNILSTAIEIEGHDKNGKDTIAKYIEQLGNYAYSINVRGILTQLVYNDKFSRNNTYILTYKPLIILLSTNPKDVEIRCRMTKEPKINVLKDTEVYESYARYLEEKDLAIVWRFNTSLNTPFQLGNEIVQRLKGLNPNDFILSEPIAISSLNLYSSKDLENEEVYYGPLETKE